MFGNLDLSLVFGSRCPLSAWLLKVKALDQYQRGYGMKNGPDKFWLYSGYCLYHFFGSSIHLIPTNSSKSNKFMWLIFLNGVCIVAMLKMNTYFLLEMLSTNTIK